MWRMGFDSKVFLISTRHAWVLRLSWNVMLWYHEKYKRETVNRNIDQCYYSLWLTFAIQANHGVKYTCLRLPNLACCLRPPTMTKQCQHKIIQDIVRRYCTQIVPYTKCYTRYCFLILMFCYSFIIICYG